MNVPVVDRVLIGGSGCAPPWDVPGDRPGDRGARRPRAGVHGRARCAPRCGPHARLRARPVAHHARAERRRVPRRAAERFEREAPELSSSPSPRRRRPPGRRDAAGGAVAVRLARAASLAAPPPTSPCPPAATRTAWSPASRRVVACITPFNFRDQLRRKDGRRARLRQHGGGEPAPRSARRGGALPIVAQVLPPGVLNFVGGQGPRSARRSCSRPRST